MTTKPLALMLQVHPGDADRGLELVKLITDIEPRPRDDVAFILACRRDVPRRFADMIVKLAREKFPDSRAIFSKRFGTGWPMGCNDLWQEAMTQVSMLKADGKLDVSGVLTFEPDCIPLRPDWINVLIDEWTGSTAQCIGHRHGHPPTHINGNAIFRPCITRDHPELAGSDAHRGWDVCHGQKLMGIGADTWAIYQVYRITDTDTSFVRNIRKQGKVPALFHGIKDGSGIMAVREMMNSVEFYKRGTMCINDDITVTISIVAMDNLELTKRCIESVIKNTQHPFQLMLWDNASTDGTAEYFSERCSEEPDRCFAIHAKENQGFVYPNLVNFQNSHSDYFVMLNNDATVPENWLELLLAPLEASPLAALSGPMGNPCEIGPNFHGQAGKLEYLEGSCLCVKRSIIEKLPDGLFAPYVEFAYGEDSDLSLRVREAGYTIHQAPFEIEHQRSATSRNIPGIREIQHKNLVTLNERWAGYLQTRSFPSRDIVINRTGAVGDVLLVTPIVRAIKQADPLARIHVQTNSPEIFENNPNVVRAEPKVTVKDARWIDLDMSYESMPETHIVRAYEHFARYEVENLGKVELVTDLYSWPSDREWAKKVLHGYNGQRTCILHVGPTSWPGKNWPIERFVEVENWLLEDGWNVIRVGLGEITTTILQLAALMVQADLFVGIDSFPMHCAQATGCPTVGIFGVSSSKYIMTDGSPHIGLDADPSISCAGLRHREAGKTFISCSPDCIQSVTVEQVKAAILKLTNDRPVAPESKPPLE